MKQIVFLKYFYYVLQVPSHSRLVTSIVEITECTNTFIHIAIKRSWGYFHHILINNWELAKKTIFEYTVQILHLLLKQGEVMEKEFELKEKELKDEIHAKNVYIINAPDYPNTPDEKREARERLSRRVDEKAYALVNNNCEHLINHVLTGNPKSEQIKNAGAIKKFFIDSIDHCFINASKNVPKLLGSLLSCIPVKCFIYLAIEAVKNEAKKSAVRVGAPIIKETFSRAAKYLSKTASKVLGRDPSCLLNSKSCMSVAEKASKRALRFTGVTTVLVTGTIEVVSTSFELATLKKQQEDGYITQDDYDREWYKKISGAVGATVGSVGLGVLGQALLPFPVLGYAIGNVVGNFCGRWLTSAFAGYCFDRTKQ